MRDQLLQVPKGHESLFQVKPPNPETRIYSGWFELRQGSTVVKVRGRVFFRWLPSPRLCFTGTASNRLHILELERAELLVKRAKIRTEVFITQVSRGQKVSYAGSSTTRVTQGQRRPVRRVQFHLVNFHQYLGESIRYGSDQAPTFTRGRLHLKAHGWRISLDEQWSTRKDRKKLKESGGYLLSHVGQITRPNEGTITFQSAERLLEILHFYFGFLRGFWCGPVIPVGLGITKPLWTNWASWKLTPRAQAGTWFPDFRPTDAGQILRSFQHHWRDPMWQMVLRHVVYWYVHANVEAGTTDVTILSSFIGLETLGWAYVVEDQRTLSRSRYDGLHAADKIRRLLTGLGIPLSIPTRFSRLHASASRLGVTDGPGFLARARNALVHPSPANRRFLGRVDTLTKWELSQLGQSYLELALLSILNYRGQYQMRVFSGAAGEAAEDVPWI